MQFLACNTVKASGLLSKTVTWLLKCSLSVENLVIQIYTVEMVKYTSRDVDNAILSLQHCL